MDNVTEGLYIAASILIFVLALSLSMFLFSQLTETAEVVFDAALKPAYYSEIEIDRVASKQGSKRVVSKNDIVAALYRYPTQTIAITILDENGKEYQVFDKYIESQVRSVSSRDPIDLNSIDSEFLAKYNNVYSSLYLFGSPWVGSTQAHRERVDLFVNSEQGYINGKLVDYKDTKGFNYFSEDKKFIETVLNYKISGEGLYDEETGTEVVTSELGTYKTEVIYQAI